MSAAFDGQSESSADLVEWDRYPKRSPAWEWDMWVALRCRCKGFSQAWARDCTIFDYLHYGDLRPLAYFLRSRHEPDPEIPKFLSRMVRPAAWSPEEVPYALELENRSRGRGRPQQGDTQAVEHLKSSVIDQWFQWWSSGSLAPDWPTMWQLTWMLQPAPWARLVFVTKSRRTGKKGGAARGQKQDLPSQRLQDFLTAQNVKKLQEEGHSREDAIELCAHVRDGGKWQDDLDNCGPESAKFESTHWVHNSLKRSARLRRSASSNTA